MTTLREAAQQALEALQAYGSHAPNCDYLVLLTSLPPQRKPCSCGLAANITALRAALQQEAKDWKCFCDENGLGVPGVTCGDCPRDYKTAAEIGRNIK